MKNSSIRLTLMRNSRKIEVDVKNMVLYKPITLGFGTIISLIEHLNGSDFLIVDETVTEIDELIAQHGILVKKDQPRHLHSVSQRL